MDIVSIFITLVLAALMLALVLRLPLAIFGNLRAGHRFRAGLGDTLQRLRLSRMLGYLGIDQGDYLHKQSALDIRQQMTRCEACTAQSKCDQVLTGNVAARDESLGFCGNIDELRQLRDAG